MKRGRRCDGCRKRHRFLTAFGTPDPLSLCPGCLAEARSAMRERYPVAMIAITERLKRNRIYRRDGGACRYCGLELTRREMTADHVMPRSRGGSNSEKNLVTACRECNSLKADRTPQEAGMVLLPLATPAEPLFEVLTVVTLCELSAPCLEERLLEIKGVTAAQFALAERYVKALAFDWVNGMDPRTWLDLDAYVGEALASIPQSVLSYDPWARAQFPTYAQTKARYALLDELRRQDPAKRTRRDRIRRGEADEEECDKLPVSFEEFTIEGDGSSESEADWTEGILLRAGRFFDQQEPDPESEPAAAVERLALEDKTREWLEVLRRSLTVRELVVFYRRHALGETQTEVGRHLQPPLSQAAVVQIEKAAEAKVAALREAGALQL